MLDAGLPLVFMGFTGLVVINTVWTAYRENKFIAHSDADTYGYKVTWHYNDDTATLLKSAATATWKIRAWPSESMNRVLAREYARASVIKLTKAGYEQCVLKEWVENE
jgi:hypothetical protein